MNTVADDLQDLREQLKKGSLQRAYRGLMQFMLDLKTRLAKKYPDFSVPGGLYQGTMDMTYFSFTPTTLKDRQLKVAIVFVYETFRFEAWLSAVNKQVQARYWQLIKESGWDEYHLVPGVAGYDGIVECVLVADPDFSDPAALGQKIEAGSLEFISQVEGWLAEHVS